ncbi:MAG: 2-oxoacid:acceptor oxidoreductase family protein [Promethearchaeota archaeon]
MNKEIIVLGRGGQGGVTCSQIIAEAAFLSGNYKDVAAIPTFGTERRGSPVLAFTRISDKKIWTRQNITTPDLLIVLDESILMDNLVNGIKNNGVLIINTDKCASEIIDKYNISDDITVACANITHLCREYGLIVDGEPMVNTPILAILSKIMDSIDFKHIEFAIKERFSEKRAEKNILVAKKALEFVDIREGIKK